MAVSTPTGISLGAASQRPGTSAYEVGPTKQQGNRVDTSMLCPGQQYFECPAFLAKPALCDILSALLNSPKVKVGISPNRFFNMNRAYSS